MESKSENCPLSIVHCQLLRKRYGDVEAVKDVSFDVAEGEIFGLIGPDGAGKTSLFRMLTTLIIPDSGSAQVLGLDVVNDYKIIRNKIGYMPGRFSLYQDLTVEENLTFFATLFNTTIQENYHLIKDIYTQIEPFKNRRAGKLSGGMKQKLALCCALIHKPEVLFLDEPTTGVDAVSRNEFWEMLRTLKSQGVTILVSTPYMDEASLCDRIALMQNGSVLSIASPDEIIAQYPSDLFAIKSTTMGKLLHDLRSESNIAECFAFGEFHHFSFVQNSKEAISELLHSLEQNGNKEIDCKKITPTIEDCFIHLMKNEHE